MKKFNRYAQNLADGQGGVFNPGEKVEGYSSPAWVFMLAELRAAGLDLIHSSKIIGILSSFALLILLYHILNKICQSPLVSAIAVFWFAVIPEIHVYMGSGM